MEQLQDHLLGVYNRAPVEVERGEGVRLYRPEGSGRAYLDFVPRASPPTGLGHAAPRAGRGGDEGRPEKVWHVSKIFSIPDQEELAGKLCAETFAEQVFFTNSGTEAIESR